MGNVAVVARKEFQDLLNSKLVLIILAFYVIMLFNSFYNIYNDAAIMTNSKGLILMEPGYDACYFGSLVAIVLGFSSMSVETSGKALNTLLVKPVYRDTVINGKLLGICVFLSWIFWITVAIYTLAIYIIDSNLIRPYILLYIERLPFVFLLYLVCSLFFYSLSVLMSILFKEQSFALFISLLSWMILGYLMLNIIIVQNIADSLSLLFGGEYMPIISTFSPLSMVRGILREDVNGIGIWIFSALSKFTILFLYSFFTTILAYIAFLRRDIA